MSSQSSDCSAVTGNHALSLLADNPDGCTAPVMLAHGFSIELLNQLIRAGLVTARTKRVISDEKSIEIVHMKITDAGHDQRLSPRRLDRSPKRGPPAEGDRTAASGR
jgi:hypothetical protein